MPLPRSHPTRTFPVPDVIQVTLSCDRRIAIGAVADGRTQKAVGRNPSAVSYHGGELITLLRHYHGGVYTTRIPRGKIKMAFEFDWDEHNTRHIRRHGVSPREFEEAMRNERVFIRVDEVDGEARG
jgi:hypothetical protein